jgi:outer membrane protein assembly factor BamB
MKTIPFLVAGLMTASIPSIAQDWPQWGGTAHRNMFSPAKGLPDRFEPGKMKKGTDQIDLPTTKNVKWVAKLGSQAYGNTTVANGRVYVGTNNESPRDPKHQGDRSILMCLDEKSGDLIWQLVVPKLKAGKVNDWDGLGHFSAAVVEGDRLYVVTTRCEVLCLDVNGMANGNDGPYKDEAKYAVLDIVDAAGKQMPPIEPGPKDADIIWRYDMMFELGVFPHNASNCSALIIGDVIYVCTSNGQDWTHSNIPSPNSPSFIALNKKTGEFLGEDDAKISQRIFHGQWSSPSMGTVNGRPQVYFGGGDGWCYAFDPIPIKQGDSSFLKTVWKFDCNPPEYKKDKDGRPYKYPAPEGPSEIIATPVFYKNRVYVATGQDPEHQEGIGHLTCIDATKTGDVTKTGMVWDYKGVYRTLSTVSIDPVAGLLFLSDFSGFVHCLDAETGKLYWKHDMKAHMWGSTLVADGKVFIGDEDGDFAVIAVNKGVPIPREKRKPGGPEVEAQIISEVNLGAAIYSTPIVANGVVYVATQYHLFAFHDSTKAKLP